MPDAKLLIVENNPTIAAAIEQAGETLNLDCDIATDGWDAIEKLRDRDYAAIVIDSDVPRHSGYGVITWLRQEKGDRLSNVVLMTSAGEQSVPQSLHVIRRTDVVDEIAAAVSGAVRESSS